MKIKVGKNLVASFSYKEDKESILHELNVIAAREGKHKSEIIIALIEEYVKAHSSGNDSFKLDNWQEDPDFKAVPTILSDPQIWYKYLQDCTPEDRTRILKQANIIRTNAINIGNLKPENKRY
jgi:hypothetical protein